MKTLAIAAAVVLIPVAALAQEAPGSEVLTTAPRVIEPSAIETAGPTPALGLSPAEITAWLATRGVTPGEVQQDGDNQYVRVVDGAVPWLLFFQSCQAGVCADLQFSTGFATPAVTPEVVNGWNRDRRFLKAFYEPSSAPGEPASAVVQYDLFLRPDAGPEQLADHLAVWRGLAPEFARLVSRPAVQTTP